MAFDASAFDANSGRGTARFTADHIPMPDFHDFDNSVSQNPKWVPGHISFEVTWWGGGDRTKVRDDTFDYGGEFTTGPATMSFTVSDDGSSAVYSADKDGQRNGLGEQLDPGVGHERNGVFFH
jgi:hypothetical protein